MQGRYLIGTTIDAVDNVFALHEFHTRIQSGSAITVVTADP